ncbi:uncharacterized protein LOC107203645 [Parus major]|uniref:uncharacterized protein LOC107203645 n=1 Tax=Parus major TaxID=9157 RepID=UPI0007710A26|nr:uncharacterized protein LOC107203645 [Parus major]
MEFQSGPGSQSKPCSCLARAGYAHPTPWCCTWPSSVGAAAGCQEGTGHACSASLEAPWNPGDVLAALEMSRCTSKPYLTGKWVMGLWGGCHFLRVKQQSTPLPSLSKGAGAPLGTKGLRSTAFPSRQGPSNGTGGQGADGVLLEWEPSQEGRLTPEASHRACPNSSAAGAAAANRLRAAAKMFAGAEARINSLLNRGLGANAVYPGSVRREQLRPGGAGPGPAIGGGGATSGGPVPQPAVTAVLRPSSRSRGAVPGLRPLPRGCPRAPVASSGCAVPGSLRPCRSRGRALSWAARGSLGVVGREPKASAVALPCSHPGRMGSLPALLGMRCWGPPVSQQVPCSQQGEVRALSVQAPSEQHGHPTSADGSRAGTRENGGWKHGAQNPSVVDLAKGKIGGTAIKFMIFLLRSAWN